MNLSRTRTYIWLGLAALLLPGIAACGGPAAPAQSPVPTPTADASSAASGDTMESPDPSLAETEASPAAGAGESYPNAQAGVLRMNHGAEPDTIDPQKLSWLGEIAFAMMNYQPLMRLAPEGDVVPGAAESMDVSEDGTLYTFTLPDDAQYSDGTPLTAEDFEFAWKRLADPETAGEYQSLPCGIIKGYSEYSAAACQGLAITETLELDLETLREEMGVRAIDERTLEIELEQPAPFFPEMTALWIGAPVRQQDVELGEDWWYDPGTYIGNGPFILTEWDHGSRAVWEPNPHWRLGPVKLERVEWSMITESQVAFQAFRNGELDVLGVAAEDVAAVEADPTLSRQVIDTPGSCTFYIGFNTTREPFDNMQVRQAFAQAFDREAWVRDVLKGLGQPTQTFIPPEFPGYEPSDQWAFDPEAARQTLADAGFPDGKGLPEIRLTYSQSARNQPRFEWMANQIRENLGIDVTLEPVDPTAYSALTKDSSTTPQMFFLSWCADYPDPQNWISLWRTGGILQNRLGWSNERLDELTLKADRLQDEEERLRLYSEAQNILIEEAPVAFLYNDIGKILVRPYVKGITEDLISPLDPAIPGFYGNLQNIEVAP